jgi:hypothetical protein
MQPGVGELHLRLDPGSLRNPELRPCAERVFQQRGLAHARLAANDQRAALPRARREQLIEGRALGTAAL